MRQQLAHYVGFALAAALAATVQAQAPVRGLPGADRVYNYGAYGTTLPASPYAYPAANYPMAQPVPVPGSAYRPVVGYVPQGTANNGYVTAGYAPVMNNYGVAGVTTGYAPANTGYPQSAYGAVPVTTGYAQAATGYAPQPLATPVVAGYAPSAMPNTAQPDPGYMTPVYSPFVRPAPNYTPPNFVYRPSSAPNAVTYYRPVTVYDPNTGVPVTYMNACRGTECRPQPQYSYFGSLFHHKKSGGTCATGTCGSQPAAAPYYPAPVGGLPGATIPVGPPPVMVPSTPTTSAPLFPPPPGMVIPSGNPPVPRSTVPPPATVFPPGSVPPGNFAPPGTFNSGALGDPANSQPVLRGTPPTTLSPNTFQPGFSNYPPAEDTAAASTSNALPATGEALPQGQGFTNDGGKTYYYYRGTVKQPFSEPATNSAPPTAPMNGGEIGTGLKPEVGTSAPQATQPSVTQPQVNPPMNNGSSYQGQGYQPAQGPLRLDVRPSGLSDEAKAAPNSIDRSQMVPVAPREPQPTPSTRVPTPFNPSIRPLPDPEPNGPINRAPQLLNPRDKTA